MENREKLFLELMKFYGVAEITGPVNNNIIVSWFKELGFPEIKDDETAWCSLTINIMARRLSLTHTGRLDARSWMQVGKEITDPKIGHIVVYWRESISGWKGHVGLFAGFNENKTAIMTLGGNQGNMIGIRAYPIKSASFGLLGFREI
jgi:uncharacterized protein (TIGR02594 family)